VAAPGPETPTIYQHPLAYLLGLEGVALLRAFAGEYDAEFTHARFDDVRRLLDSPALHCDGTDVPPISAVDGYRAWAPVYDEPGNGLIDLEEPVVHEIVDALPAGVALDAACGTGRHARHLAGLGHTVTGVDSSPDMLAIARRKVPGARFLQADLHRLPLPDGAVDLVVCALALTHVPDLRRALAELARVMRPGGHLVVSDSAGLAAGLRPPVTMTPAGDVGGYGHMPHHNRRASDYLQAALPLGLQVRRCEEPRLPEPYVDPEFRPTVDEMLPAGPPNIWWLHHWCPLATNAALRDTPVGIIWHFQLDHR
jgi:SAM-dependent methyltransferase